MVVLKTLTQVLSEQLADGNIVRLGNFGSFQVSIGSEGVATPEKFNTSLIKTRKVMFRSGGDIREMLEKLRFEKH
jgi:predicted histone-like DNA-binding protein